MLCHPPDSAQLSRKLLESEQQKVLSLEIPAQPHLLSPYDPQILDIERDVSEILRATKTIRNACIPVNKLPPEILSKILECRTSERDLVISTHVCRYWRSTLVSTPSLWTCFRFKSSHDVDRTLTYLERSRSAPVDVEVDMDLPRDSEVFGYLAPHIATTRSLIIRGDHAEVRAASLLFCTPSQTLQYLKVRAYSGLVRLPDNYLGRQAPSLSVAFAQHSNPISHSLAWLNSGYTYRRVRVRSAWVRCSSSSPAALRCGRFASYLGRRHKTSPWTRSSRWTHWWN